MRKILPAIFFIATIFAACSSGKNALDNGDYFSAVIQAVQRLKANPDNKKAAAILEKSYPLALQWSQEEIDLALSGGGAAKWDKVVTLMERVNGLASEIRQSPVARQIIPELKVYSTEIKMAKEKAAEESYNAGIAALDEGSREAAREAFSLFLRADDLVPGYQDVAQKLKDAKEIATVRVVLEAIPVHAQRFQLSSEFFYNQIFEYLNQKYPRKSFVNFYSPAQAEAEGLGQPDMIVRLEFYDFVVGNTEHSEKESEVKKDVRIETKDTTKVVTKTYIAKLKTFADRVTSGGRLNIRIVEFGTEKLLMDDLVPGSFTWVNEYAIFVGDKEALSKEQKQLLENKVRPMPEAQDLFLEFTKPIYTQLTGKLNKFFSRYN